MEKKIDQTKWVSKEVIGSTNQWLQYFLYGMDKISYSGFGVSSLPIPNFHLKNTKLSMDSMKNSDFQYQQLQKNKIKDRVIEYFPPVRKFKDTGIQITSQNVLISPGALSGISMTVQALTAPGDQIILIEPIYPFHLTRLHSRNDIGLRTCRFDYDSESHSFKMNFESLKQVLNEKSRILIICNPCNPTSKIWSREEYEQLSQVIRDYPNLYVIEDAAYFLYHSDKKPYISFGSISKQNFNRSVTLYSAGKMFNLTGIRIGFGFGPTSVMEKILRLQYKEMNLPSAQDQYIIAEDLKDAAIENYYENQRQLHHKNFVHISEELTKCGFPPVEWGGTYYFIIDVEKFRNKLDQKWYKRMDNGVSQERHLDKAFSRLFCLTYEVGMIPLSQSYMTHSQDRFIRLAFNRNDKEIQFMLEGFRKFSRMNPKINA